MSETTTDNVKVNPGDATDAFEVATDLIGNVHYPIYKMSFGALGAQIPISEANPLPVTPNVSRSAFGEQSVAQLTPITNIQFAYNAHPDYVTERHNNGSSSVANSMIALSTGAAAGQSAQVVSKIPIKYYTGIGGVVRFTTIYTTGVAGSAQLHGVGDSGDGYFFGYNGADFGVLRRSGGNPEVRAITITTKSTTAENITITLDGDADATVAVTDATAGDVTTTVNEIAAHDFSNLGRGWTASAHGDKVVFMSWSSESRTGTYSLSGATTAVGTQAQELAGVSPTDIWTLQADWSENVMSSLDPTKGNVYQIKYQWLGFGQITFYIENPDTGDFEKVHRIKYANENTAPSVQNPTLPLCIMCENHAAGNTSDLVMKSSSMAGFVEGKVPEHVVHHTEIVDVTFTNATLEPVITLHNDAIFQGKLNRVRARVHDISVSVESGKSVIIQVIKGAVLTGASFAVHSSSTSVIDVDTSAGAYTNGDVQDAFSVASGAEKEKAHEDYVEVDEFLTIVGAQGTSGTDSVCKVIITWTEDF